MGLGAETQGEENKEREGRRKGVLEVVERDRREG
jgi:hypothetical protein